MDPREQPFADVMAPMDFAGEDSLLEGEIVDDELVEDEPAQLDIGSLMREHFGSL